MTTMRDVAQRAGGEHEDRVARLQRRPARAADTRALVEAAMRELNYVPNALATTSARVGRR